MSLVMVIGCTGRVEKTDISTGSVVNSNLDFGAFSTKIYIDKEDLK